MWGRRAVPRSVFVLFFVLDLVMMTGTRQRFTYMNQDPERQPTIFAISFDDDITLDDQALQAGSLGREQRNQRQRRDPGWPEPLECFHVFAESLNKHTQPRISLKVRRFEKSKNCVPLVVNQEIEWDDQALEYGG